MKTTNWYNEISRNLSKIPDCINYYETEYQNAKKEVKPEVLVCSYHGVPKRYLMQGDPYHCQCQKTTRLLKERLGWKDTDIITTFQSKFGPEEWLKPYTVEEVARLVEEENKGEEHQAKKNEKFKEVANKKIGRNERCLCGSGKKYKHCCGRL